MHYTFVSNWTKITVTIREQLLEFDRGSEAEESVTFSDLSVTRCEMSSHKRNNSKWHYLI
jgi:hypothetical protein